MNREAVFEPKLKKRWTGRQPRSGRAREKKRLKIKVPGYPSSPRLVCNFLLLVSGVLCKDKNKKIYTIELWMPRGRSGGQTFGYAHTKIQMLEIQLGKIYNILTPLQLSFQSHSFSQIGMV